MKDGTAEEVIIDHKLMLAEGSSDRDVSCAVIHAGPSPVNRRPLRLADDHGEFEVLCAAIWRALTTGLPWAPGLLAEHSHELLIAGRRPGQSVQLVRLGNDAPPQVADGRYAFGLGVASGKWHLREEPRNMAEAIAVGLELFTAQMRERISDASRLGVPAGVQWPANVAWISPDRIDTLTLGEPHHQCRW
jgi:hypothetical protein